MKPLAREWVAKAEEDFAVARRESRARAVPAYGAACFHAQQCAEKYFKALLCEHDQPVERTHDLSRLLVLVEPLEPTLAVLAPAATLLTDYAVRFRYPGATATRRMAETALNHCKLIRDAIRRALIVGRAAPKAARPRTSRGRPTASRKRRTK
ncbi:MAG: HEPN domain-containing protein [Phycisphaerales bacterium]|nr:HEPN domain-containing protein [Phycisphaerales bacterium]